MKRQLLKIGIAIIFIVGLISCDEPNPTELITDNTSVSDDLEIEALSPEPGEFVYANGYDSTGITQVVPGNAAIISLSSVRNTFGSFNENSTYYGAIFFDRSKPVRNRFGRVLGFRTRLLGRVFFNGDSARAVPYIIKFKDGDAVHDTLAGFWHLLSKQGKQNGNNVRFRINPFIGQPVQFDITTPPEINGSVKIAGSRVTNNLGLELLWNARHLTKIEIIIGGVLKTRNETFPIFKLRTKDDGHLWIPESLIKKIPFDKFNSIVISFIRRYTKEISNNSIDDNFVTAQSIHNIKILIP